MMTNRAKIRYIGGYKYQLVCNATFQTEITGFDVETEFLRLQPNGQLDIMHYYCWDGPSGPTLDTKNFMCGSLVHDALYQLIRLGLLSAVCRVLADQELYRTCRADGMSWIRARLALYAVRNFGAAAANPKNKRLIQVAP